MERQEFNQTPSSQDRTSLSRVLAKVYSYILAWDVDQGNYDNEKEMFGGNPQSIKSE